MRHFTRPLRHCSPPPGTSRNSLAKTHALKVIASPWNLSRHLAALLLPRCGDSADRAAPPKTFSPDVRRFSRRASEDEGQGKAAPPPEQALQGGASPPHQRCAGRPRQNLRASGKNFDEEGEGFRKRPLTRLGPEGGRRDGAKPLVGGQLSELCSVFPPDFPLHEGSRRSLHAKPQVSLKQVGLFWEMVAHNSLK